MGRRPPAGIAEIERALSARSRAAEAGSGSMAFIVALDRGPEVALTAVQI